MMTFATLVKYELLAAQRRAADYLNPALFFVVVVSLFPLAITTDPALLATLAPGIIWVAALLASLLALNDWLREDAQYGVLDKLLASPQPAWLPVMAKLTAHWLCSCLPLLLLAPLLGVLCHLPAYVNLILLVSLALGTPILTLLGAIGVALTLGVRHQGLLLPLLILPLFIPVLIFGTGAVLAASLQLPVSGYFALLAALLIIAVLLAPLAIVAALKIGDFA